MNPQDPYPAENASPDDLLARAIASQQAEAVPPGPPSALVEATLKALRGTERADTPPVAVQSRGKRFLATASSVILALAACWVLVVLVQTDSPTAFARMIEPILKARSARFNIAIGFGESPPLKTRMMIEGDGRLRQELPGGQVQIIDPAAGKFLMLNALDKSALLTSTAAMPSQQKAPNYFDLLRNGLRAAEDDPAVQRESLGTKQIDGRDVVGYRVKLKEPSGELTIWGDPKTELPVTAELKLEMLPAGTYAMSDFEFDVPLDEALFETTAPPGYHLIERTITTPTEADLIAGLKLVAEHNAGRFPDTFGTATIAMLVADAGREKSGLSDPAQREALLKKIEPFNKGFAFAATLPADAGARYAGKDLKLGDAAAVVFWYKPAGAKAYRVIHGDLSITEQADAPTSPNAAPITFETSGKKLAEEILKRSPRPALPAPEPLEEPPADSTSKTPLKSRSRVGQADDPAARRVLDQMLKVYADCTSYRDSGVSTTVFHHTTQDRKSTSERPFSTVFVRSGRFRFEFSRQSASAKRLGGPPKRCIIWSDGSDVRSWWDEEPGIKKPESLYLVLKDVFGESGATSGTIANLLIPEQVRGGMLALIRRSGGFTLAEDGTLGDRVCYRVLGTWGNDPMTIWIDNESYLVRRIDTSHESSIVRTEKSLTYEPVINEDVAEKLLEFNPPTKE